MYPQRFIAERNIDNFHSRLLFEEEPGARDLLLRLLIEEEDRFGGRQEQISIVQERIIRGATLIQKQQDVLSDIRKRNGDSGQALRLLSNFVETQELLYRRLYILECLTRKELSDISRL